MDKARSFANVTACRAVSNPAWYRIFGEISCISPLNIKTLFRCRVLGQGTLPSYASLDSGVNEYLVGQTWQFVRNGCKLVLYAQKRESKWYMNEQVQ